MTRSTRTIDLSIPDEDWTDNTDRHVNASDPDHGRSRLLGPTVWLNGVGHFLEAVEVLYDEENFEQRATSEDHEETLDLVYRLSGQPGILEPTTIGGREYVVFMTPFS